MKPEKSQWTNRHKHSSQQAFDNYGQQKPLSFRTQAISGDLRNFNVKESVTTENIQLYFTRHTWQFITKFLFCRKQWYHYAGICTQKADFKLHTKNFFRRTEQGKRTKIPAVRDTVITMTPTKNLCDGETVGSTLSLHYKPQFHSYI